MPQRSLGGVRTHRHRFPLPRCVWVHRHPRRDAWTTDGSVAIEQNQALVLGQTAPDSVHFLHLECVSLTGLNNRAMTADFLCSLYPRFPVRTSLTPGVEEVCAGHVPAGGVGLPCPGLGRRYRKTPGGGHTGSFWFDARRGLKVPLTFIGRRAILAPWSVPLRRIEDATQGEPVPSSMMVYARKSPIPRITCWWSQAASWSIPSRSTS